jgi:hypothetical protein
VRGELPRDEVVTADVGDVVELTIHAEAADKAQIPALGLDVPVEPDVPGTLRLVADREGRFPVRLRWAGEEVGVLQVGDER